MIDDDVDSTIPDHLTTYDPYTIHLLGMRSSFHTRTNIEYVRITKFTVPALIFKKFSD